GQLLLSLDDREAQSALRQAELERRAAEAQIAELNLAITSHQKQLAALRSELAGAGGKVSVAQRRAEQIPLRQRQDSPERAQAIYEQAQARLRRAEDLRNRGLMSEQEYEAARAEMKIAEADLESAKRAAAASQELARAQEHQAQLQTSLEVREQNRLLTEMQSQLEQARLRLLRADEALKTAQRHLSETQIRATTRAVVVDIPARTGDLVASGMTLMRLANLDSLIVEVPVDSRVINALTKGQRAVVTLPVDKQQVEGRVLTINPIPSENLSYIVEVVIENSSGRLLAGQAAEVQFSR
ncbi:MAG: HlyD family efflux transporter periplasmic adaptor subunit, partial [Candidatus Bathyarchaeia archaeon]